jgi:hypothetical protein
MKTIEPRFAFISGGLGLGGATTFLLNLGSELSRLGCRAQGAIETAAENTRNNRGN